MKERRENEQKQKAEKTGANKKCEKKSKKGRRKDVSKN